MKLVQTIIFAMMAFFLSAGISVGAELDDLDLTIRVIESDDLQEMQNELSLPASVSDDAREHAEGDERRGESSEKDHDGKDEEHKDEHKDEHRDEHDGRHEDNDIERDEREDEIEDHDEAREDDDDVIEGHDEAHEEESHEEEHEKEDDDQPGGSS